MLGEPRRDVICVVADAHLLSQTHTRTHQHTACIVDLVKYQSITPTENTGCQEVVWQPASVRLSVSKTTWKVLNRFSWNFEELLDSWPRKRMIAFWGRSRAWRDFDLWASQDQKPRGTDLLPLHEHTHTRLFWVWDKYIGKLAAWQRSAFSECFSSW